MAVPKVGKADEFSLCDICGRNVPMSGIAGQCKVPGCSRWMCSGCAVVCAKCGKVFCPDHASNTMEIGGKTARVCDSCYVPPKKGRCFIATAAYGSELDPHVTFMRNFRDKVLLKSTFASTFSRLFEAYYKFSPPIAKRMEENRVLKVFFKYLAVVPIVAGFEVFSYLFNKKKLKHAKLKHAKK